MTDPSRILIIRPSALGDVCRSVPVLVSLRERYPVATIDWLVQSSFAPAIAHHPALNGAIPFPRERMPVGSLWKTEPRRLLADLLHRLRGAKYDLVLDCQGLGRSGFFTWWTGAPRRVGYANAGELGWLGYTDRVPVPRDRHTVDRMLALVEAIGLMPVRDLRLYTSEADRAALDPRLRGTRFVLIAPTSRWEGKRWPASRFAEVARTILGDRLAERVALVGAASEREQCAPLLALSRQDDRVVDLIGATTVGALMATVEASALILANDSAALHMAVGFDRPLFGLFGPTRIDLVGPYGRQGDVITPGPAPERNRHKDAGFGRAAMEQIPVGRVLDAVRARLSGNTAPTHA